MDKSDSLCECCQGPVWVNENGLTATGGEGSYCDLCECEAKDCCFR